MIYFTPLFTHIPTGFRFTAGKPNKPSSMTGIRILLLSEFQDISAISEDFVKFVDNWKHFWTNVDIYRHLTADVFGVLV